MSSSELHGKEMKLVSFCPVCEARSKSMLARPIRVFAGTKVVHMTCQSCSHAFLAMVMVERVGASTVGLLTDLSFEDALRVEACAPISVDDVLSAHRFLQAHTQPIAISNKTFAQSTRRTAIKNLPKRAKNIQKSSKKQ